MTIEFKRVPAIDKFFPILQLFAESKHSHGISEISKQQVSCGNIPELSDFLRKIAYAINQRFSPAVTETGSGKGCESQFFDKKTFRTS